MKTKRANRDMLLSGWGHFHRDMNQAPVEDPMVRNRARFAAAALAATLVFLSAAPGRARHSGAMFDMAHPITLTSVVTKVEWTNPRTFMYVNVKNEKGAVEE
jgi:hypothetical protein